MDCDQVASIGRDTNEPAHKTSSLMVATGRQCAPSSFKRGGTRTKAFAPKWQRTHKICTRVKVDDPPTHLNTQACDPHTATLCSSPTATQCRQPT